MRTLPLVLLWFLPTVTMGQGGFTLSGKRMPDFAAELLLGDGVTQRDIARPSRIDSDIFLIRLYEIPEIGGCEGTDETCKNHYALLLEVGGMPPSASIFDLGTVGEITEVQWVSGSPRRQISQNPPEMGASEEVTLLVTVQNYPSRILRSHSDLTRQMRNYHVVVNLDSMVVKPSN